MLFDTRWISRNWLDRYHIRFQTLINKGRGWESCLIQLEIDYGSRFAVSHRRARPLKPKFLLREVSWTKRR